MKLRFKTWYWGKFIFEGTIINGTKITRENPDFEEYIEEVHGWHNSEEFKKRTLK